jgi:RNA polymerase sigma factor (sigma-70 family)
VSAPGGGELREEVARGQRLDRELARALGRREPTRAPAGVYVEALEQPSRPALEDERSLVDAAKAGDAAARARLIDAYLPAIAGMARGYRIERLERIELLQEGAVGLLRALERYDPGLGVPFWGYAAWWVRHAMQQLVSELTGPVVLSDRALRDLSRLKSAHLRLAQQHGREPSLRELAERAGIPIEQAESLLGSDRPARSLDEPIDGGEGETGTFGDLLADPLAEDEYERVLGAVQGGELHALLAGLSERERGVLRSRYGLDGPEQSLRDLGERLGISGERVRQIERRALGKLAAALEGDVAG